jgi:hypothetical protein
LLRLRISNIAIIAAIADIDRWSEASLPNQVKHGVVGRGGHQTVYTAENIWIAVLDVVLTRLEEIIELSITNG